MLDIREGLALGRKVPYRPRNMGTGAMVIIDPAATFEATPVQNHGRFWEVRI